MPQGVRAHLFFKTRRPGVAHDYLVQALAGKLPATSIRKETRLVGRSDQVRPPALQIHTGRFNSGSSNWDEPLLGAFSPGAQNSRIQIEVPHLKAGCLGCTQPACIHQLEHGPIAQCNRLISAGLFDQPLDFRATQDLRQVLQCTRWRKTLDRIGLTHALLSQELEE